MSEVRAAARPTPLETKAKPRLDLLSLAVRFQSLIGLVLVVIGGVIPEQDFKPLRAAGVDAIFPPGTVIAEAAESLLDTLNKRLGHTKQAAE